MWLLLTNDDHLLDLSSIDDIFLDNKKNCIMLCSSVLNDKTALYPINGTITAKAAFDTLVWNMATLGTNVLMDNMLSLNRLNEVKTKC